MSAVSLPPGWPALPDELRDVVVLPEDVREYSSVQSSYMKVGKPGAVFLPTTESKASAVVRYASSLRKAIPGTPFSVRSGGHGIAGTSTNDGGIILDLKKMNRIKVLGAQTGIVQVEAGAIWGDVALALAPHNLALTSGNFGDTGVGGLATTGGLGYFARSQGLTLDCMRSAKLLTADGTVRWVDAENEPDLFWAVRGGGAQVGIALEFVFHARLVGSSKGQATVIKQTAQYLATDLAEFTKRWGAWIKAAPEDVESFLMVQKIDASRFVVRATNIWANDDVKAAGPTFAAALQIAQVLEHSSVTMAYSNVVPCPRSPHYGQQNIIMRDVLVDHADASLGEALAQSLRSRGVLVGELRALGGAVAKVKTGATAWAGRHQEALVGIWANPSGDAAVDEAFAPLQKLGTGAYGAYSSDTRPSFADLAWPGATGDRLREISERVDPERLFDYGLTVRKASAAQS